MRRLAEKTGTGSIFVAADTAAARDQWHAITRDLRLVPWSVADQVHDRTSASGAVGAMLDWRILGAAEGLVYSRESSFGHEAATAMGPARPSVGLTASRARQRGRSLNALARSAFSYPRRTLVG